MADVTTRGAGLHEEQLTGRTQQVFFNPEAEENYLYHGAYEVDFERRAEFDAADMDSPAINHRIRELMEDGNGTIVVKNPGAKHGIGVGILNRLNLHFEGSLGYFAIGCIDGPNVRISGRVGWSCAENMLAGTVLIEKNSGSCFGAAIRGGDLACRGNAGARVGIDQKGGTIMIGGHAGAFTGFMMQRGRIVILGDAGTNLGDSMYDGTIYVGGTVKGLGTDAVSTEMTDLDVEWLGRKLALFGMEASNGVENMQKIVAGKELWNYDSLEPHERKLVL